MYCLTIVLVFFSVFSIFFLHKFKVDKKQIIFILILFTCRLAPILPPRIFLCGFLVITSLVIPFSVNELDSVGSAFDPIDVITMRNEKMKMRFLPPAVPLR